MIFFEKGNIVRRTKIDLVSHIDLKRNFLDNIVDNDFLIIHALVELVKAIEKDYNNEKIEIPERSAVAARNLGAELVQSINDWARKGRHAKDLNEYVGKCVQSINNHRTDIEAAPGFSNWFFRQLNTVIAIINGCMDVKIEPYVIERTQMSYSGQALFKPAVNKVRQNAGKDSGLDLDPSLDL